MCASESITVVLGGREGEMEGGRRKRGEREGGKKETKPLKGDQKEYLVSKWGCGVKVNTQKR